MTTSLPRLVAMSLCTRPAGAVERVHARASRRLDALIYERIDARPTTAVLALLLARATRTARRRRARSCATSSSRCSPPATRRPRARSAGRSSGSPATPRSLARVREGDDAYLDAVVKEVLRVRPVLSIAPRKTLVAVRGRRLDAAAGRARDAVHLPRAPPRPTLWEEPDRVPARALPRRRARARTRSSRSAAACAAASARRSRRSRCARCCARSPRGSTLRPTRPAGERMRRALDHADARAWRVSWCRSR